MRLSLQDEGGVSRHSFSRPSEFRTCHCQGSWGVGRTFPSRGQGLCLILLPLCFVVTLGADHMTYHLAVPLRGCRSSSGREGVMLIEFCRGFPVFHCTRHFTGWDSGSLSGSPHHGPLMLDWCTCSWGQTLHCFKVVASHLWLFYYCCHCHYC